MFRATDLCTALPTPRRSIRGPWTSCLWTVGALLILLGGLFGRDAGAGLPPDPPVKLGGQFPVHTQTNNDQFLPHVDYNASGEFACTWTDDTNIKVRVFHPSGSPKTPELLANTTVIGTQNESQVAIGADGRTVVIWTDYNDADGELLGVLAQRFDPNGNKVEMLAAMASGRQG